MLIGADPEIFAFEKDKLIPAFHFLGPKPDKVKSCISLSAASHYWDGFQAEFRFNTGFSCLVEFSLAIQKSLRRIKNRLNTKFPQAHLSMQNTVRLDLNELTNVPDRFVALGCEPSFNAYDLEAQSIPDPRSVPWRSSGGHLHFSGLRFRVTKTTAVEAVKRLDARLGIWSIGAAQNLDIPVRRRFYGLAGEFRIPSHTIWNWHFRSSRDTVGIYRAINTEPGLEYRTLSNFWLSHPRLMQITCEIARLSFSHLFEWDAKESEVVEAIQNMDVALAQKILKRNKTNFIGALKNYRGFSKERCEEAFNVGLEGIEKHGMNPAKFESNWQLDDARWIYNKVPTWNIHDS